MKQIVKLLVVSLVAMLFSIAALAEEKTLEQRVSDLENTVDGYSIPEGFFINGNIEGYYDDRTYDSGWDSRAELQLGIETDLQSDALGINWVGGTMKIDSHYSLDTTQNNKLVEKQLGFGNDFARLYIGETDAQRMGFAKTPKISAPLIYTENNYRIDHNEKTVLTFGGWQYDNEFDFDSYRLSRETPWGVAIGYDNNNDVTYATGTVSLMGYADLSYMRISAPSASSNDDCCQYIPFNVGGLGNKKDQEGIAIGGSLHRFGIPMLWGIEKWDDKNAGNFLTDQAKKDRWDYGVMYNVTKSTYVTAHRTENDDLGYTGNYYGIVHNVVQNYDPSKRADKQDGLEIGLYFHDKEQTSVFTGTKTDFKSDILASIRYKF